VGESAFGGLPTGCAIISFLKPECAYTYRVAEMNMLNLIEVVFVSNVV
jgi:hypothetical protein